MLYLYDNAIANDIDRSFEHSVVSMPKVKVLDSDGVIGLISQMQNDEITFPIVSLVRSSDTPIDTSRTNFTQMHKGVPAVLDNETNMLYHERAIPVSINYELSVMATNTADVDELVRELMFKYVSMYFLTITLPYEFKRTIRFGVRIDTDKDISKKSGVFQYIDGGVLYETIIPLKCEGCVMVSYTASKLNRSQFEIDNVSSTDQSENLK